MFVAASLHHVGMVVWCCVRIWRHIGWNIQPQIWRHIWWNIQPQIWRHIWWNIQTQIWRHVRCNFSFHIWRHIWRRVWCYFFHRINIWHPYWRDFASSIFESELITWMGTIKFSCRIDVLLDPPKYLVSCTMIRSQLKNTKKNNNRTWEKSRNQCRM